MRTYILIAIMMVVGLSQPTSGSETLIGQANIFDPILGGLDYSLYDISPDHNHFAYVYRIENEQEVVIRDGQMGMPYDDIQKMTFSADSQKLAYLAKKSGKLFVVVDGREEGPYDDIDTSFYGAYGPFYPEGHRIAYGAKREDKWFMVDDGIESNKYNLIQGKVLSPDGSHLAYVATQNDSIYVLMDGRVVKEYEGRCGKYSCDVAGLVLSSEGRLAYIYNKDGKECIAVDGSEGKGYDDINYLRFSPDGQRLAFVAGLGEKQFVVLDGVEGEQYDKVSAPSFSPDSRHLAYIAHNGKTVLPSEIVFIDGMNATPPSGIKYSERFVVIDVKEGKHYRGELDIERIGEILDNSVYFSPDSQHVAYEAELGSKGFIVMDEAEGPEYEHPIEYNTIVFSPDSSHLAYDADDTVILDGRPGNSYDYLFITGFSPDSKHLVYMATENKKQFVVVDGVKGSPYDDIIGIPYFVSSTELQYYALRDDNIYRVTEAI